MDPRQDDRPLRQAALTILADEPCWHGGGELAGRLGLYDTRALRRRVIAPLRFGARVPIHYRTGSGGGYKLAVTAAEHTECLRAAKQMGRDFFAIASMLQAESLDIVMAQLAFEFLPARDDLAGPPAKGDALAMLIAGEARRGRRPRWLDVVQNLLTVMAERPDEYAAEIEEVRHRFGGLFLPPDQRQALAAHLRAAEAIITGAGGSK